MASRKKPTLSSRKRPQQARSEQMVADILEASIRVLRREGAAHFTTIRVAQEAGISVGSLYQYFPNKGALLFRLQVEEWSATSERVLGGLLDQTVPTVERLRHMILEFYRSELDEVTLRQALVEAGATFRGSPEAVVQQAKVQARVQMFFREALPHRTVAEVVFLTGFFMLSMGAIAEKVTDRKLSPSELEQWMAATAELLCSYLERLQRPS